METITPPRIDSFLGGMEMTESICKTSIQQGGHLPALLIGEACIHAIGLGILQVNLLMRHIHIATHDDGLALIQFLKISTEIILPSHTVIQSAQTILAVGCVHTHEEEALHLESNHPALMVMLLYAYAISNRQRMMLAEDGRSAVPLLLSIIPPGLVSREFQFQLSSLHLGLLQAEEVCIK